MQLCFRLLLCSCILTSACQQVPAEGNPPTSAGLATTPPDSFLTLRLLVAGDAMQHIEQVRSAQQKGGAFNYGPCFQYIKPVIQAADLAIVNLETTLPGPPYAGYPNFRSPDAYALALKDAGFDVFTLANNHSIDAGNHGVTRTIRFCDSLGIPHVGTYRNDAERLAGTPLIVEQNGFRLALLNYTYGTNYQFTTPPVQVNYIDTVRIKHDILVAQGRQPDAIIVLFHWGVEYKLAPAAEEEQLAAICLRAGARLVIGGHPHVVRRAERFTYNGQDVVVAYSQGNFLSAQRHANTDGGMLLGITLRKNRYTHAVTVPEAGYKLIWVNRRPTGTKEPVYEVLPVDWVEQGRLQPSFEAAGRAKLNRFAAAARTVLSANIALPEMHPGYWLDKPIGVADVRPLPPLPATAPPPDSFRVLAAPVSYTPPVPKATTPTSKKRKRG